MYVALFTIGFFVFFFNLQMFGFEIKIEAYYIILIIYNIILLIHTYFGLNNLILDYIYNYNLQNIIIFLFFILFLKIGLISFFFLI